ncbi:MAG: hypothetical protein M0C28_13975 [Candidatus Moduliflexus flocculans]|nr:hypothetical protein [Candidatus Moduliflexus flocculans]
MKKNTLIGRPALAAAVATILVLAAVTLQATPTAPKAPAPAATVLEYKMPAGRALTYQSKSEETQVMEVMGQSMDTHSTNSSTVTFKSKGPKDKNLLLGVTIDEMAASLTSSAAGDMSPDLSSLKGKAFDMVLSPLGSEVDVAAAEAIKYDYAGSTRNIASGFKMFFPDLPDKPVKIGDTWPSNAGVDEDMGEIKMRMDFKNVCTLEGFETVDGMECARVSTAVAGTLTGSGSQQGMDMTFAGTTKGKETWYFAMKEGLFIKSTSETTTEMSIDVPAAGMTIPATATAKSEVKLTAKQ